MISVDDDTASGTGGPLATPTGLPRLPFIDGVRGVAAAVVMFGHLIFTVPTVQQPGLTDARPGDLLVWPFRFGTEMVCLFLMVSGFSLHYSERVRRVTGRPASTYREFMARRGWRIVPVYYAACALGLAVAPFVQHLHLRPESARALPVTPGGVLSHLAFVQNLRAGWYFQVNSPLWSIAYEAQLYLLFPLIFLAMRRWNPVLVAAVVVAGDVAIVHLHLSFPVFGLARWFVAGALLAELTARGVRLPARFTLPVGLVALGVGMAQIARVGTGTVHDAVWLVAFGGLLLAMTEAAAARRNPMTWRWVRWVGLRSYSLYALHWPLLLVFLLVEQHAGISGSAAAALNCAVGVPIVLLVVAAAYRWVETPSLRRVRGVGAARAAAARQGSAEVGIVV